MACLYGFFEAGFNHHLAQIGFTYTSIPNQGVLISMVKNGRNATWDKACLVVPIPPVLLISLTRHFTFSILISSHGKISTPATVQIDKLLYFMNISAPFSSYSLLSFEDIP
jgi:hypothetical protein